MHQHITRLPLNNDESANILKMDRKSFFLFCSSILLPKLSLGKGKCLNFYNKRTRLMLSSFSYIPFHGRYWQEKINKSLPISTVSMLTTMTTPERMLIPKCRHEIDKLKFQFHLIKKESWKNKTIYWSFNNKKKKSCINIFVEINNRLLLFLFWLIDEQHWSIHLEKVNNELN